MPISKEELKEQIKKELFKQLLEQKMVDEGVTDFLKSMGQKALSGVSNVAKKGADALQTVDVDEKKLDKIADFLQTAQRDPEISKLILTTKLGKAILGGEEQNKSLQEILTGDFAQMMKAKKITNADIDAFIKAVSANAKANKMLKGFGIDVPQADKPTTPSQDQPGQQTAQTQSTQEKPDTQQTRKDNAAQVAQSANKGQTQSPDKKNLQAVINKVRNPQKDSNQILAKQPIMARLSAAGFTPQQAKFVSDEFIKFLKTKVSKTAKGPQIKVLEQDQPAQQGHNNLRVFDNSNRSVMGQLITLMKKAVQDPKLGKSAKPINDTAIAGLAKELAKDIANQARVAAGLSVDSKDASQPPVSPTTAQQAQKKELGTIGSGEQPGIGFGAKGFDDNQKKQLIRRLSSQGFKADQVTKVVNSFSDWLKNRSKQQPQQMKEGTGSAQVRELVAQFAKETNLGIDEKMRTALVNATIKAFGSPAQQSGPVQKQIDPVQRDAEVAAKMASEKNPNPSVDVPRTQSSDIPQPAEPKTKTGTGSPVSKALDAPKGSLPAVRPLPAASGGEKTKGTVGRPDDLKAVKTSSIQVPDKYKGGLSDQQMKSVAAKAAKAFESPEEAQTIASEFSEWLKEKASIKSLQELRSFLKEATEEELSTLFDQFLKQKGKTLTPQQRSGLLSAFSSTEETPATAPEGQKGADEQKKGDKEVKQSNHPVATAIKAAMKKIVAINPERAPEAEKFSKAIDELIENGKGIYNSTTGDEIGITSIVDFMELFKTNIIDSTFIRLTVSDKATPETKISFFKTCKELQKDFDSINQQLGGDGIFAGNFKFFFPTYGIAPSTETQKIIGTVDSGGAVVGGRAIGFKYNKDFRPTSVMVGKPDPKVMDALGTSIKESLKEILVQEIFNTLTGKHK